MNINQLKDLIIYDITHSKCTSNIKLFKENIHNFSKEDLKEVVEHINNNIYLGQRGVDDLTWIGLKKIIKSILDN